MPPSEHEKVLERLRKLCASLPNTSEMAAWGHPNFKVANKTFAAFEKYRGEWAIAFKLEREHQQFLVDSDERFYVSPYVGKHGWVSMKVGGRMNWAQVKALIAEAHRLTANKREPNSKRPARGPR